MLGWNSTSWNGFVEPPPTEVGLMPFANLTLPQQGAVLELCYLEETWDVIPLPDWPIYNNDEIEEEEEDIVQEDGNMDNNNETTISVAKSGEEADP